MMTLSSRVAATAIASLFLIGSAFAETPAPAAPAPAGAGRDVKIGHSTIVQPNAIKRPIGVKVLVHDPLVIFNGARNLECRRPRKTLSYG